MEAAKTFDRNGIRYRPGDALPTDLDATTLAHYRRHGMVREIHTPAPTVKKPAAPRKQAAPKPVEIAAAVPVPEGVSPSAAAASTPQETGQEPAQAAAAGADDPLNSVLV